jgi:CBS-domain-containing membrane protein
MRPWRVRDLMTREVLTADADARPAEAVAGLTGHDVSALAVVDGFDNVLGVLTRTDVLDAMVVPDDQPHRRRGRRHPESSGWRHPTVRQMMSAPAMTIGPDHTAAQAGRRMHRDRVNRLLVTDHRHHLLGIVTAADLLRVHGDSGDTRSDDTRSDDPAAVAAAIHATLPATAGDPEPAARHRHDMDDWWPARLG